MLQIVSLAHYKDTQLAESLRVWCVFRDKMKKNLGFENYHLQDSIWWNKNIRLKTKKFFFYQDWYDRGICVVNDPYRGLNIVETFEDLVFEFDISIKDRRKYNSLMNGLLIDWFYNPKNVQDNIFDQVVATLLDNGKITNYSYTILKQNDSPTDTEIYWFDALNVEGDIDWCKIHNNNFTCRIETQLRAFNF